MERFNRHRADLKAEDEKNPALHFRRNGHNEEDMGLVGLEHVPGQDDAYRITRERGGMNRMGTFKGENRK